MQILLYLIIRRLTIMYVTYNRCIVLLTPEWNYYPTPHLHLIRPFLRQRIGKIAGQRQRQYDIHKFLHCGDKDTIKNSVANQNQQRYYIAIDSIFLEEISGRNLPSLILCTDGMTYLFPFKAITHRELIVYTHLQVLDQLHTDSQIKSYLSFLSINVVFLIKIKEKSGPAAK